MSRSFLTFLIVLGLTCALRGQENSIAREWNEVVLEAIRNDFARPTIHARNLFHTSAIMYNAWALFDVGASPYLPSEKDNQLSLSLVKNIDISDKAQIDVVLSHGVYHLLMHRYKNAPGFEKIKSLADSLMLEKGLSLHNVSLDYASDGAEALGNYLAFYFIQHGLTDGSNEQNTYANRKYTPINEPLNPAFENPIFLADPNRWQPLLFSQFIDQSGNLLPEAVPSFLSPEWGEVLPFALENQDYTTYSRLGNDYQVALDPGPPAYIEEDPEFYKWGFSLVSEWSSHLDPSDNVLWDISPRSLGNIPFYPENWEEYKLFYKEEGGDNSEGRLINPISGEEYKEQIVPRGDYARVLAEFWADGPDSETPPGHWFEILNYVMDQSSFTRNFAKTGRTLNPLEYDVKAYFLLGGAMHDAAISAWSIKGWYDYIRPISAIRYLAGQAETLPIKEGLIEIIGENDPDFFNPQDLGKVKVKAWKGHSYVDDTDSETAGVGWILAEDWWPYQRPSFVTPPFAGYVSGHSTFSRAAADILTYLTGSEYFPGGLGEFKANKNEFLVFEEGPSQDVILQWATYRDAADQCSLSRIWGGIHPPVDDLPGRKIGAIVAKKAIRKANNYFHQDEFVMLKGLEFLVFPNPADGQGIIRIEANKNYNTIEITSLDERLILKKKFDFPYFDIDLNHLKSGLYIVTLYGNGIRSSQKLFIH